MGRRNIRRHVAESFPKKKKKKEMKDIKSQIHKAQRIPGRLSAKTIDTFLSRYIIFSFLKTKDNMKILKSAKEKKAHHIQRNKDINWNKLLSETLQALRQGMTS